MSRGANAGAGSPLYDKLTVVAISALAAIVGDVLHEGLGHAGVAILSGAHRVTVSTVAMQSEMDTKWIAAAGPLTNLVFGAIFWLLLLRPQRYRPAARYFLILAMAGNLFTATGYPLFSGVSNFGDFAQVIAGWHPLWLWRVALIAVGAATYYASMLIVADKLRPFRRNDDDPRKMRTLCWVPYFTQGILAGVAGLFNPAGIVYVFVSALPASLGAMSGLLAMPGMLRRPQPSKGDSAGPVPRSAAWIAVGAIVSLFYIFVIGRGVTWTR